MSIKAKETTKLIKAFLLKECFKLTSFNNRLKIIKMTGIGFTSRNLVRTKRNFIKLN